MICTVFQGQKSRHTKHAVYGLASGQRETKYVEQQIDIRPTPGQNKTTRAVCKVAYPIHVDRQIHQ